tara:strand:- start:156 stop:317 length:162 start_codon:yes stop_codon:yes gene_type:complete
MSDIEIDFKSEANYRKVADLLAGLDKSIIEKLNVSVCFNEADFKEVVKNAKKN